jgi:hypothetical protein
MLERTRGSGHVYPHRLVVDANCINAKGKLPAMACLEEYHHAGALELIVTSTLPVELDKGSIQARKARLYQSVGAYPLFFPGEREAQSRVGAPVRSSLLHLLHTELFGRNLKGKALLRAVRDCLHLDQAQMNGADIFVTNDKRLHAAEPLLEKHSVHLAVYTPEEALAYVRLPADNRRGQPGGRESASQRSRTSDSRVKLLRWLLIHCSAR